MRTCVSLVAVAAVAVAGLAGLAAGFSVAQENVAQENRVNSRVYELRTYTTHPGRLPALHQRFREHTLKLFEKHGMKNEMYWVPTDDRKDNTLIYIVSHDSPEAARKSWDAFRNDPEWTKARTASEADGPIVLKVESVYMTLTNYSPGK
jgi:hypothetical protein